MRTLVMADVHGSHSGLVQALQRSKFSDEDQLIFIGDICDRNKESKACIDELLKIKNLIFILGNHDQYLLSWFHKKYPIDPNWINNGGLYTINSYGDNPIPDSHLTLLENAMIWYVDDGRLFVHAGINPIVPIEKQKLDVCLWDRHLVTNAYQRYKTKKEKQLTDFSEVYVGHTPTIAFKNNGKYEEPYPLKCCEIWLMDTGACWGGKVSIMDINTKQVWQSDTIEVVK